MGRLLTKCMMSVGIALLVYHCSFAEGNPQAGQAKSTTCAACHGPKGQSAMPQWPNLAGQSAKYLYQQLMAFKKGKDADDGRYDPAMTPLMATLSEQDMQDLAAFYAKQPLATGFTDKDLLARGQALYRGGDIQQKITACIACHGPKGLGNNDAGFPELSGQHPEYVVKQLENYKNGTRQTDINSIMRDIAKRMDKADMQAVASYIAGLH